jgi:hypothetical protein
MRPPGPLAEKKFHAANARERRGWWPPAPIVSRSEIIGAPKLGSNVFLIFLRLPEAEN